MPQLIYKGIGSGSGFAIARAVVVQRGELSVPDYSIKKSEVKKEISRFREAVKMAQDQLFRIRAAIAKAMGENSAIVIDA